MKIENVEELDINPKRRFTTKQAWKVLCMVAPVCYETVHYNIKKGYLKAKLEKLRGMGQTTYIILGKDLEEFIIRKYF